MGPLTPTDLDAAAFVNQQHGMLHSPFTAPVCPHVMTPRAASHYLPLAALAQTDMMQ